MSLVLASNSPRRKHLLGLGGWAFRVEPAQVDENPLPGEDALAYVLRLAESKAHFVAGRSPLDNIIIAADTTDMSPEDYFKIQTLSVCTPACGLTASIGDKVWLDANGNGVQDSGEAGIGGVSVKLFFDSNRTWPATIRQ